ncbi:MAG: isocitrate lyase/phosphoenolpyruvate mutase family protein [Gemmatimonadaceae bacterium]
MSRQIAKASDFRALHTVGDPVILFNAWDAGSANAVAAAGAKAIATGSWSVAAAHGSDDGEQLPLDLVLANLARIVRSVDLPVTLDFERGYGETPDDVGRSVAAAISAGAIGFNIEDSTGRGLRAAGDQGERIAAARVSAERSGVPVFLNARTDLFLATPSKEHSAAMVSDALARMSIYAAAGADGLFVPGLVDEALIASLCAQARWPVNVMMSPATPPRERLAALGVARISHGPWPYRQAMAFLTDAARAALGRGASSVR